MALQLALFDLDNTLLSGDSDFEWAQFLIQQGVLDREVYEARNVEFYRQYKAGTLDIQEFLAFQLKPLSRHSRSQLDVWHREFMRTRILPIIPISARALVEDHRRRGHVAVIVTATNRFVTGPIAREFGVEHLIATEAEERDGQFTGGPHGVPCFKEGKVTRLMDWLHSRGESWQQVGESWFYSDSLNDLPLLAKVSHPVAVDPDPTLLAHAESRGWPVLHLQR